MQRYEDLYIPKIRPMWDGYNLLITIVPNARNGEELIGHKKIVEKFGKDFPTIFILYVIRLSAFVKPSNHNLVNRLVGKYA